MGTGCQVEEDNHQSEETHPGRPSTACGNLQLLPAKRQQQHLANQCPQSHPMAVLSILERALKETTPMAQR